MRHRLIRAASALALLCACQGEPAHAQNLTPSGLPPRGAVAGTDVIVDQPAGSSTVQGAQASAIATYVAANLGTPAFALANATGLPLSTGVTGTLPLANGGTGVTSLSALQAEVLTSVDHFGADPTGVNDSTTAINAALASGLPLTCSGVYKVHGAGAGILNVTSVNNHGQRLVGGGSYFGGGSTFAPTSSGACIIRPDSTSTGAVFLIDGTNFPGGGYNASWLEGFGLENLTIDMTNMSDVATNAAIEQIQAYDVTYGRVRVINDGANKRAYLAKAGAFTTTLKDFQGHIVDLEGTSDSFGVTTLTMIDADIGQFIANYATGIHILGGAIQTATGEAVYLRNSGGVYMETDIESSGSSSYAAYDMNSSDTGIVLKNTMGGWSGPLFNGTPSNLGFVDLDFTAALYEPGCPFEITSAVIVVNSCGAAGSSTFFSGGSTQPYDLRVGRSGTDVLWGVSAATNQYISGTVAGDTVLETLSSGANIWLAASQIPGIKITSSSVNILSGITFNANQASFESGSSTVTESVFLGLNSIGAKLCVAAATNVCFGAEVAGDLAIGSTPPNSHTEIAASGDPVRVYDGGGHEEIFGYPQPTAGSGTASVSGNDSLFVAVAGSAVTSSAVNFSTGGYGWASTPTCIVSGNTTSAFPAITSISTSAVTIGWSASVSGAQATVRCNLHN